ncbi:unnamed protein product [Bursaphelenchus okinawaensis]|uniref:Uncharacterized protein n=1 Tax=Bursaphelenchus okinawaensis TaxID=465554 RepID=A0A811L5B0_9BILA|nr:unnamed protein product [Bursaphelenchus okinawaensis]CAG9116716.1 unnamed protein product [Bursaphelenchus okinawaensis]
MKISFIICLYESSGRGMNYNRPKANNSNGFYGNYSKPYGKDFARRDKNQQDQKSYKQYENESKSYQQRFDKDYRKDDEKATEMHSHHSMTLPHLPEGQKVTHIKSNYNYKSPDRKFRANYPTLTKSNSSYQKSHKHDDNRFRIPMATKSTQTDENFGPIVPLSHSAEHNITYDEAQERHKKYIQAIQKIQFQQPTLRNSKTIPDEYDPKVIHQYYRWDPVINTFLFDEDSIDGPMDTVGYMFWKDKSPSPKAQWKKGNRK